MIFPLSNNEPIEDTPVIIVAAALVTLPFSSIVIVGTEVAPPYTPAVTPELAKVVANEPVPEPVTSPVKVIV